MQILDIKKTKNPQKKAFPAFGKDLREEFFYAEYRNGTFVTKGTPACSFGYQLEKDPDGTVNGIWVSWEWKDNQFTVKNDRYGMYPLFYFISDHEICVSPSISKILSVIGRSQDIDYPALAVFLRLGFFLGENTPFKDIKSVPPNAHFQWKDGCLKVKGSRVRNEIKDISFDTAIDAYIDLFRNSMKKCLPSDDNFILPLSGGRDSRHILLELNHLGIKPKECVTSDKTFTDLSKSEDARIARMLCQELAMPHRSIARGNWFDNEDSIIKALGFCSDEGAWELNIINRVNESPGIVYDGLGGDVLSNGLFLSEERLHSFQNKNAMDSALELLSDDAGAWGVSERSLSILLSDEFYKKVSKEAVLGCIAEEIEKHKGQENPVSSFFFWNRTRREIGLASLRLYSNQVYFPYLDNELYDFLTSLPPEYFLKKDFHDLVIKKAYPEFCHIPYEREIKTAFSSREISEFRISCFNIFIKNYGQFVKKPKILNYSYLLPRFLGSAMNEKYAKDSRWMTPSLVYYFTELERWANI